MDSPAALQTGDQDGETTDGKCMGNDGNDIPTPTEGSDADDIMDDEIQEGWACLPDILLESVFSMLTHRQRYYCSMVCRNWYATFNSPRVWRRLVIGARTFTYRRFNLYKGYQHEISHHRVQMCLGKVGHHAHYLEILPMENFFNLYEFLNVLSCYLEFFDEFPMPGLHSFKFTFACESRGPAGPYVHGTGGMLLQQLKRLLSSMSCLRSLTINNLLLDPKDYTGLLDGFIEGSREHLLHLEVLNCTNRRYPFMYGGKFINLQRMFITPQQLSNESVLDLAQNTALKELVIVQDDYAISDDLESVNHQVWWEVKEAAPHLRVRLEVRGKKVKDLLIQENAPVHAVVFDAPHSRSRDDIALSLTDEYPKSLRIYAHKGLPRIHGPRSFHNRGDSSFILLLSGCPNLETLVINERISTATLLLLASRGRHLKHLHVRRNALILRCDWPKSNEWQDDFYAWLRRTSQSYETTQYEVGRLLMNPTWKMLSDWEFKQLNI